MRNKFYLHEFKLFDGEEYITFNIVALNESKKEILVAVTNRGRITQVTYDLFEDENGYYFEYGCDYTKVKIEDFKEVKDEYLLRSVKIRFQICNLIPEFCTEEKNLEKGLDIFLSLCIGTFRKIFQKRLDI